MSSARVREHASAKGALTAIDLAAKWECAARNQFMSAADYPVGSMERRALEHGAMCYFNCAAQIKASIQELSPMQGRKGER